jgi:hypothetical protein
MVLAAKRKYKKSKNSDEPAAKVSFDTCHYGSQLVAVVTALQMTNIR